MQKPHHIAPAIMQPQNEVIETHIETITHIHQEGQALQADVYNFYILLDVYDSLPPRPNAPQE